MDKFPTNGPVPSRDVAAAFNQENGHHLGQDSPLAPGVRTGR